MSVRFLLSGVALVVLTACGGGGGGGGGVDLGAGDADFAGLDSETDRLRSYFASSPTLDGDLPTSSTANYDGVILFGEDLDPGTGLGGDGDPVIPSGYLGQVDITVDFSLGSRSINGTGSNFYAANLNSDGNPSSSGGSVTGSLIISNSNNFTTNDITFDVDGTVDSLSIDGTMDGRFASTASNDGPVALIATEDTFIVGGSGPSWNAVIAAD